VGFVLLDNFFSAFGETEQERMLTTICTSRVAPARPTRTLLITGSTLPADCSSGCSTRYQDYYRETTHEAGQHELAASIESGFPSSITCWWSFFFRATHPREGSQGHHLVRPPEKSEVEDIRRSDHATAKTGSQRPGVVGSPDRVWRTIRDMLTRAAQSRSWINFRRER